ncbi:outer membrane beta-barrel protein [Gelidibacter sp.]|uniref:outer membrane beta-barrel protein n=1 Tax=Gelidibacter sp. TaxID=2018083 RepID=UPI002CC30278|nr:outer membrane beta-barrel protein [Gelidibacter sp.]HUH28178.1 outer membrane beta-barrel protein [Gelidibacter sp.]
MKKLFLLAALAIFGTNLHAQDFKLGINAGLPLGNAGDVSSFSLILDAGFLWEVSEEFDLGVMSGFSHSFGKEAAQIGNASVNYGDVSFIPIAGAARFNASDKFTLGLDLGYAIGVSDGNDGGFYYAPRVQYGVSETMAIVLAYRGISMDGGSFDILSAGLEFRL